MDSISTYPTACSEWPQGGPIFQSSDPVKFKLENREALQRFHADGLVGGKVKVIVDQGAAVRI